jgi:hypothetical protein
LLISLLASAGCRIRSKAPYWIETHGHALGPRIAGWSFGVLLLGGDEQLWGYPGPWADPWAAKARTHSLRAIAASNSNAYALLRDGAVSRFNGGSWAPFEGSQNWGASEIGATEDDHLLLVIGGKLKMFDHGALKPLYCDAIDSASVAGTHGDEAFVLDQSGALYFNAEGRCDRIAAPARLLRIAARPNRLVAVAADGSVWRRRAGAWSKLPAPFKYRDGQAPVPSIAQDVAVSSYSTWMVDNEGSVFLLSDET